MNGQMRNWLNGMISEFVKNSPENSLKMEPDEKAWVCLHSRFTTVDLFKNLMDILGPDKGFRVLVVDLDEIVYCGYEVWNVVKNSSTDTLSGEFCEPSLDQVQP